MDRPAADPAPAAAPPGPPGGFYAGVVDRPVAIVMIVLAFMVFGAVSLERLPLGLMPDLAYPTLTVRTVYDGAAPQEVEEQVSRPLEQALSTTAGLLSLESTSRAGQSDVVMEFAWGTDMDEASQAVRERSSLVTLPDGAGRPLLLRYDPAQDPIIELAVAGGDDLFLLRRLAEEELERRIEMLPGVAAIKVQGGLEREVAIQVREDRLHAAGLTVDALVERLSSENVNLAGGSIREGDTEYLIRTLNEFRRPDEIAALALPAPGGTTVRFGDVADVRATHKDRDVVGRLSGAEAVEVAVYKEADANLVDVSRRVRKALFGDEAATTGEGLGGERKAEAEEASAGDVADKGKAADAAKPKSADAGKAKGADAGKAKGADTGKGKGADAAKGKGADAAKGKGAGAGKGKGADAAKGKGAEAGEDDEPSKRPLVEMLPKGVRVQLLSDQAEFVRESLADVASAAWAGGLLAIVVLYLFLRHGWSTFIVATIIPSSVAVGFAPMYLSGLSLNLMSLGGLGLSIGMLIDNAVVVLESIHRCREEGDDGRTAAVRGTREVAAPVAATTFTTIAVFFPITFVEGIAGRLFGDLALAVCYTQLASLGVALLLIPVLAGLKPGWIAGPPPARLRAALPGGALHAVESIAASLYGLRLWVTGGRGLRKVPRLLAVPLALVWIALRSGMQVLWSGLGGLLALGAFAGLGLTLRAWAFLRRQAGGAAGRFLDQFEWGWSVVAAAYERLSAAAVARPSAALVPAAVLFAGSLLLVPRLGAELLPELHRGQFLVSLALPVGTPLDRTVAVADRAAAALEGVKGVVSVWSTAGVRADADAAGDEGEHTARLLVTLAADSTGPAGEARAREAARRALRGEPDLGVEITTPALFSFRTPIEVAVYGDDLDTLRREASRVEQALGSVPGLRDVRSHVGRGYPEVQIRYRRDALAQVGLDAGQVARAVRAKVQGRVATELRDGERGTDVRVVLREADRDRVSRLGELNVNPSGTPPIPLSAVADLAIGEGPSEIRRIDQRRAGLVTASTAGFDLGRATTGIEAALASLGRPAGVRYEIGGQSRELGSSQRSLLQALVLAVFLVYVIMACQFESIRQPAVILFSVPLAVVGVVAALAATGTPLSVLVLIGAIVLAGVVVNNAIVLLDYALLLRQRGLGPRDAIHLAGRVRLRPILITAVTTVFGLLPMALGIGPGAELRQPLALTVIAGMASSTVLTLVVIPAVYALVERDRGPGGLAGDEEAAA